MPSPWNFPRNVQSMKLMAELAESHGLSRRRALAGTGVSTQQLNDPDALVRGEQELRLIQNLVEGLKEVPALGLEAGQRYHFTAFGALGFAMMSSRHMHEALEVALQYFQLTFAFSRFQVDHCFQGDDRIQFDHRSRSEKARTHLRLSLSVTDIPAPLQRFILERDAAAIMTVQRDLFGTESPLEAFSFSFPEPDYADCYRPIFGLQPDFGRATNEALLNLHRLQRPLPQANELARKTAEGQCRALLERHTRRSGFAAQTRDHLLAQAAQMPDMNQLAATLCLTPRTLRRRLAQESTSFSELRDELRQTLAKEFLESSRLSVDQIAVRLGYTEATSFINAFKRWFRQTPHAYRLGVRNSMNR